MLVDRLPGVCVHFEPHLVWYRRNWEDKGLVHAAYYYFGDIGGCSEDTIPGCGSWQAIRKAQVDGFRKMCAPIYSRLA